MQLKQDYNRNKLERNTQGSVRPIKFTFPELFHPIRSVLVENRHSPWSKSIMYFLVSFQSLWIQWWFCWSHRKPGKWNLLISMSNNCSSKLKLSCELSLEKQSCPWQIKTWCNLRSLCCDLSSPTLFKKFISINLLLQLVTVLHQTLFLPEP